MEITSINAHCRHRHSIWDVSEFPAWAWIKGTQRCRDVVDDGSCRLPAVSNAWAGLSRCGAGGLGSASERRGAREVAGAGRAALQSVWCQWLCVTGQGGELILSAGSVATLPCTCGPACADPTPRDAQMLLVTALGVLEEKCSGAV